MPSRIRGYVIGSHDRFFYDKFTLGVRTKNIKSCYSNTDIPCFEQGDLLRKHLSGTKFVRDLKKRKVPGKQQGISSNFYQSKSRVNVLTVMTQAFLYYQL